LNPEKKKGFPRVAVLETGGKNDFLSLFEIPPQEGGVKGRTQQFHLERKKRKGRGRGGLCPFSRCSPFGGKRRKKKWSKRITGKTLRKKKGGISQSLPAKLPGALLKGKGKGGQQFFFPLPNALAVFQRRGEWGMSVEKGGDGGNETQ